MAKVGGTAREGSGPVIILLAGMAVSAAAFPAGSGLASEQSAGTQSSIRMGDVEIRGEVERPDVFYIIPRRQVELSLAPRTKDYKAQILEPLLPGPFEEWVRSRKAQSQ